MQGLPSIHERHIFAAEWHPVLHPRIIAYSAQHAHDAYYAKRKSLDSLKAFSFSCGEEKV